MRIGGSRGSRPAVRSWEGGRQTSLATRRCRAKMGMPSGGGGRMLGGFYKTSCWIDLRASPRSLSGCGVQVAFRITAVAEHALPEAEGSAYTWSADDTDGRAPILGG